MRRVLIVTAALLAAALIACGGDDDEELTSVTLMLDWVPNAHHAGIYAAAQQGWYEEVGIDISIIEPAAAGAEAVVGAGTAEFGISFAEAILPARAAGAPIVSIAAMVPHNFSSLMALADEGIERPRDLAGKTYGGFGGQLERKLISTLVACDGGDPDTIEFVEVGAVDYLTGMDQGHYDFVWVFEGWDVLRAREIAGRDVTSLEFVDYLDCIPDWYTPAIITSEKILAEQPELVQSFLEATARGYAFAIAQPGETATLLLDAVPELDEALVRASIDFYAPLYADPDTPWGMQDAVIWATFEEFLRESGLLETAVDTAQAFTNEHLPQS